MPAVPSTLAISWGSATTVVVPQAATVAREFGDAGHGTFDVHVGVDEPGGHGATFQVNGFGSLAVAESDDISVFDGDAPVDHAPGKDVDDPGAGQQQIGGGIASGGCNDRW